MSWLVGFGRFWYDFIVGDSAILAIGGAAVLVIGWLLVHAGGAASAQIVVPAVVIATLIASLGPLRG
jgi:ammonia channel protein AmtB